MSNYVWKVCEGCVYKEDEEKELLYLFIEVSLMETPNFVDGKVWFFGSFVTVVFC